MKAFMLKMIMWVIGVLALAVVTVFVLYYLAWMIAIAVGVLLIGLLIGPPLVYVIKEKRKIAMRGRCDKRR